jgi:hypothetical protein
METQEELMKRILTADAEQYRETLLLKEDGATPLKVEAAQDYINELEAQVKLLGRSKDKIVERLNEYQGEKGPYILFKDMLLKELDDYDVMTVIKDEVLDGLPDIDDIEYRIANLEDEKVDEYEITDTVVDSMTFESKVREIVAVALQDISIETKIDTTNLE